MTFVCLKLAASVYPRLMYSHYVGVIGKGFDRRKTKIPWPQNKQRQDNIRSSSYVFPIIFGLLSSTLIDYFITKTIVLIPS